LTQEVQQYQTLLQSPDVANAPDLSSAIREKWIAASCQIEVLQLPTSIMQNPHFVDELFSSCSKRLHSQPAIAGVVPPGKGAVVPPKAAANDQCSVDSDPPIARGANTKYGYTIQCDAGVTPKAMAISTAQAQPAITDAQGSAFAEGFASALGIASSYDSANSTVSFTFPAGAGPHSFELLVPTASTQVTSATYLIASGAVHDATTCQPGSLTAGCSSGAILIPVPKPKPATTCPNEIVDTALATPTLDAIEVGSDTATGTVPNATSGNVRLCIGSTLVGNAGPVDAQGKFTVKSMPKLSAGQKIQAQYSNAAGISGPVSPKITVGSCSADQSKSPPAPKLSVSPVTNSTVSYSGTLASGDNVRICVNDLEKVSPLPVTGGKFGGGKSTLTVSAGDKIVAQGVTQGVTKDEPPKYGMLSNEADVGIGSLQIGSASSKPIVILIGGVEYAGYSSQAQTTDGFLNIFYQGPVSKGGFSGWGRVRLTSAPEQATNGVVSVIANPTGLTTYNYSNVGQVLDYVFGPAWKIPKTQNWKIIGGFGGITPLSSQNVPVTFLAPAPGTQECSTLVNRFSVKNGYSPGLSLNTAAMPTTCIAGGYTAIAFTNQDRTNFLMKYGAGVRTSYPLFGPNAWASVDATMGQDASVTGGYLRGVVFKVDAIMPIPTGTGSSWLYLFGSAYMRLQPNHNLPPLILQTPTSAMPVTVPSPTVFELPLRQPNRDYFRLGVGLNIAQIWCTFSSSGCSKTSSDSGSASAAPKIDSLDPKTTKAGAATDLTLTVNGSNFVSGTSKVQWTPNGGKVSVLPMTFESTSKLTAVVPASDLKTAGTATVTVDNAASGGTSGAQTFTITK
jgi:hypothetical protein